MVAGVVTNAETAPVVVTSELALPVIVVPGGVVAVGGGNRVTGVGTPLNDGVNGADVMVTGDAIVTPLDVVVTGAAMDVVTGVVTVTATGVPTAKVLVPFNCVATGSAVNVPPLKARPTTPTGTSELINNNPVKPVIKLGSPGNSSVAKSDIC